MFAYSQAQFGLNLCATMLGLNVVFFYCDRLGMSPAAAGAALSLALFADALTDPYMGSISDRATFAAGRRRPFFLIGAIPMALAYGLLFSPPFGGRALLLWFCISYFLMLSARKAYENPYLALMPELALDYDERTRVATYRQFFGTCGEVCGALLPFGFAVLLPNHSEFRVAGLVAAALVVAGALLAYAGTRERPEFAAIRPLDMTQFSRMLRNRPFLVLVGAAFFGILTANLPSVLLRFLAKYWMGDEQAAASWLIAYFVGCLISYPIWSRIMPLIEKKTSFIVSNLVYVAGSFPFLWLRPDQVLLMNLLMALSGFTTIGVLVAQASALADVIDWDQEQTGLRQEGAYAGVMSMTAKLAAGASMLLVGPMLDWSGYVPGITTLGFDHARRLMWLFALGPAASAALSALVFSAYPITRSRHRELRERLMRTPDSEAAVGADI